MDTSSSNNVLHLMSVATFVLCLVAVSCEPGASGSASGAPPSSARSADLYIRGVTVLDGLGGPPRRGLTVALQDGLIDSLGPEEELVIPEGAATLDGNGHTLIPGIVGLHNHTHMPGDTFLGEAGMRLYLSGGVTTIQTTGSAEPMAELELAQRIEHGLSVGPRIFPTAPYLTGQGGNQVMTQPRSQEEAREFVATWAAKGVTWFKLYRHTEPEIAQAVIAEAHRLEKKVTAHPCSLSFLELARMGIDSIEHGLLASTDFIASRKKGVCASDTSSQQRRIVADLDLEGDAVTSLVAELVERGVTLTSTLAIMESHFPHRPQGRAEELAYLTPESRAAYDERQERLREQVATSSYTEEVFAKILAFEKAFADASGRLVAGPDTGRHVLPGFGDQRNYELLIEAGFGPGEVVQIMTYNGATTLGVETEIGSIEVGKQADLVLLAGDLEQDPAVIRNVVTVFKRGQRYSPEELRAGLEGEIGRAE